MIFKDGYGDITIGHIFNEEKKLNVTLPDSFKKALLESNEDGGAPENMSFIFRLPDDSRYWGGCFSAVCFFNPKNSKYKLISDKRNFLNLEKGLIPFGDTGHGDYICFDYRADSTTDDPPVVYWAHEFADVNDGLVPLAPNFEAFLGMLMSEEEAEAALAKANGKA